MDTWLTFLALFLHKCFLLLLFPQLHLFLMCASRILRYLCPRTCPTYPCISPLLALTGRSSVTRISVPDRNMLLHQDMCKERRELELKIHGKESEKDKVRRKSRRKGFSLCDYNFF